jgi:hypothetical protein
MAFQTSPSPASSIEPRSVLQRLASPQAADGQSAKARRAAAEAFRSPHSPAPGMDEEGRTLHESSPRRIVSPAAPAAESVKVQRTAGNGFRSPHALVSPPGDPQTSSPQLRIRSPQGSSLLRRTPVPPRPHFTYTPKINGVPYMSRFRYKDPSSIQDPFNLAALAIQNTESYTWKGQHIPFDTSYDEAGHCRTFVGGAHCLLLRIPESQPLLISNVPNPLLIVKTFLSASILSTDDNISVQDGSSRRVIEQYRRLRELSIPVARMYNELEAAQGCGFFIFEYVPDAFKPNWGSDATVANHADLWSIYNLFLLAASNHIDMDIRPSNIRRRKDGTLVLVDILENSPKKGLDLYFELENRIRTFCNKGDRIYEQLHAAIAPLNS